MSSTPPIKDTKFDEFKYQLLNESKSSSENCLCDHTFHYGITANETIELMVKIGFNIAFVCSFLAFLSILIGVFSLFYGHFYLSIFSLICILQLLMGPSAYSAFIGGKRVWFYALTGFNLLWIGFALIYFTTYLFLNENETFNTDVIHHFLFVLYLLISISLEVICVIIAIKLIIHFDLKIAELDRSVSNKSNKI